jgi:type IV secretion system protein VirD4
MEGIITLVALGMALSLGFHWGGFLGAVCALALLVYIQKFCKHYLNLFLAGSDRGNTVFGNGKPYIPPPEPPRQMFTPALVPTQGSARFATYADAGKSGLMAHEQANGVFLNTHIETYGNSISDKWKGERTEPIFYDGKKNTLTLAPTREGKGVSAIIPTLLIFQDSIFVLDLKGENWFTSLPARDRMGHDVVMINPFNIFGKELDAPDRMTNHHNPLEKLRKEQPDFTDKIQSISTAITPVDPNDRNKFFTEMGQQLVITVTAHLCSYQPEIDAGNNNLTYMRKVICFNDFAFAKYMADAHQNNPHPLVCDNAGSFYVKITEPKTGEVFYDTSKQINEFRHTARSQLNFLTHPGIQEFLSYSDFEFADLRRQPTSIFCMMSFTDLSKYYQFARLMVQCLFNAVITAPQPDDRPILVVLDEQASLGNMDAVSNAVSSFPGHGVRVWSVFQDINQMARIYGEDGWRTFMANAGIIQIMTPNDSKTVKEFSERAGYYTVTRRHRGESIQVNSSGGRLPQNGGEQLSEENIKIPLLSADDLYGMPNMSAGKDARSVFFLNGLSFPFMTTRDPYFGDKPNQAGYFRGMPYAPNPMDGNAAAAYQWMKNYLNNTVPQDGKTYENRTKTAT